MIRKITENIIPRIKNKALIDYSQIYFSIQDRTLEAIESFGLPLEKKELNTQHDELRAAGALYRNNNKSIVSNGKISSACVACQTGSGSYTTFVSLKCHRDCYFCFNTNQENYQFHLTNHKNINGELEQLLESGVKLEHLAITGGEPLLHKEETVSFMKRANELTPETYKRLYTAGDFLDDEILQALQDNRLDEIRISIKMEDSLQKRKHIVSKIALAQKYIPNVLVEMPVIPGTLEEMKELLLQLEELGIFGINLLEFCFPLGNAQAFREKGLELKNPPYEVYYNYWYAGGLAVAQSEEICLELVKFALENNLKLGVHYCSLENKFTGQIYQQNHDQDLGELYLFSNIDYYFKTVKVFGKDIKRVLPKLIENKIPFEEETQYDFLQFPIEGIKHLKNMDIELVIASSVVEKEAGENIIREVALDWTTTKLFDLEDVVAR